MRDDRRICVGLNFDVPVVATVLVVELAHQAHAESHDSRSCNTLVDALEDGRDSELAHDDGFKILIKAVSSVTFKVNWKNFVESINKQGRRS